MQIGFLYDDFDEVFNGFKVSAGTPLLLILCNLAGIGILALLIIEGSVSENLVSWHALHYVVMCSGFI